MLRNDQNMLATQTGPATPCGDLMRGYWHPAALVDEVAGERPVLPVRLLGEDLVLFRTPGGEYGLIGRHCPHRGVDLAFGRLEEAGLRCPFHGWLLDARGRCLEQPAEARGSRFHEKIRHAAYPCRERNGIIFAYLGPGEPPAFPAFDCFAAPASHTFAFKGFLECNWLQALEVGIDPAHASFLHRYFEDDDPQVGYGKQFRDATSGADMPVTKVLREYPNPKLDVEQTDFGFRILALRGIDPHHTHVRVTNLVFPTAIVIPMSNDMNITQWHVPIDDTHCWWYAIFNAFEQAVDKDAMRRQRTALYDQSYMPRLNRANNWGFDAREQATRTYTGMGEDINVHDQWAVESPGPIFDRTAEHLGSSDKAITAYRKLLFAAIETLRRGEPPAFLPGSGDAAATFGPVAIDSVGPTADWQRHWREVDRARRARSAWASQA